MVVVGYHPDEPFALAVGTIYNASHPSDVLVERYDDKPDRQIVNIIRQPRLWKFIRRFSPVNYAVVLHDPYPEIERIIKDEIECPEVKYPEISLMYVSHKRIPQNRREQFYEFIRSTRVESSLTHFVHSSVVSKRFPKEFDEIAIEYYPHKTSIQEGVEFLEKLIEFLQST